VTEPQQTGLDSHISRLRAQQGEQRRKQRMAALSGRMANMKYGWLLVFVEDGSPRSVRRVKMLADGTVTQL
jgi:hypothetical protein